MELIKSIFVMDNAAYIVGAVNLMIVSLVLIARRKKSFWIGLAKAPITVPFNLFKSIPIWFWAFVFGGPLGIFAYLWYKNSRASAGTP